MEYPDPSKFSKEEQERLLAYLKALRAESTPRKWYTVASNKQLPPDNPRHHLPWAHPKTGIVYSCGQRNPHCAGISSDWEVWIYNGGRGIGKTMAGANWIIEMALSQPNIDVAVCAPTFSQVQRVCFEGSTGIIRQAEDGDIKTYNRNNVIIYMRNGSRILGFSAENTDSIRGANLTYAWIDELAAFPPDGEFYTHGLSPALRIRRADGGPPRMMITTTPKRTGLMIKMIKDAGRDPARYHITYAVSWENPQVLDEAIERMRETFGSNTAAWKQEMEAELVDDERALFRQGDFDKYRVAAEECPREFRQVVIGVDPATTSKEDSDYTGIVVIGESGEGVNHHSYVLEDASLKGTPDAVVTQIQSAFYRYAADLVIVESNKAGDYFKTLMAQKDAYIPVRDVHAAKGKKVRAAHISHLNEIGRIHMTGEPDDFRLLEEQLCAMNPDQDRDKIGDDRADAFVWAMVYLAGKPSVDWEKVYGFGTCKHCNADVSFLSDKNCRGCGQPVTADKQEMQAIGSGEKSAVRWWHAYAKKCPRGHEPYPMKLKACPKCELSPDEFLRQAMAFSGAGKGGPGYTGKRDWLSGRRILCVPRSTLTRRLRLPSCRFTLTSTVVPMVTQSASIAVTALAAGNQISPASLCGRKALLYLEPGKVTAECTEPEGHDGIHWDKAFSLGWRSKNAD